MPMACARHRAPSLTSVNSAVKVMRVMYVSCESDLGHSAHFSDLRLFASKIR